VDIIADYRTKLPSGDTLILQAGEDGVFYFSVFNEEEGMTVSAECDSEGFGWSYKKDGKVYPGEEDTFDSFMRWIL
jgi:hypothetical protein